MSREKQLSAAASFALHAGAILLLNHWAHFAAPLPVSPDASLTFQVALIAEPSPGAPAPEPLPVEPLPAATAPATPPSEPEKAASPESAITTSAPAATALESENASRKSPRKIAPAATSTAAPGGGAGSNGGAATRASVRFNPPPNYPAEARQKRQQGVVLLRVAATADGLAGNVEVTRGSGFPLLDRAAIEAVRRWRFTPASTGGQPIASTAEVPVRFELR